MAQLKRREKLIKPALQLKIVAMFLVISALSVGLQSMLLSRSLVTAFGGDTSTMFAILRSNLLMTLAILVPSTILVGTILTFRIAGPLHRIEAFLRSVLRGEKPADCKLRRHDELQELCELVNGATRPLRRIELAEDVDASGVEAAPSLVSSDGAERPVSP